MYAASERRKSQVPGNIVTFMIDRNINYTNICTINCNFCSFYRSPGHEEGYTQTFDQISARIEELEELGGSRILMQGGGRQGDPNSSFLLEPGMVLTIEPGLYFGSWRNDILIPERYAGIGIRIEDDVLVTEQGPFVLSSSCPKMLDEIEQIVGRGEHN